MTDPLAKWQATDLRDEMILEAAMTLRRVRRPDLKSKRDRALLDSSPLTDLDIKPATTVTDAILELLARSDAGSLPDEGKE